LQLKSILETNLLDLHELVYRSSSLGSVIWRSRTGHSVHMNWMDWQICFLLS